MTPQIGEFSFVLVTSGMMSGVFMTVQVDFLFAVIAASLFVSPVWTGALHYLVVRHRIHQPVLLGAEAMPDRSGAKEAKTSIVHEKRPPNWNGL